jgi:NitT/TauT family transport system ATP-binding protein
VSVPAPSTGARPAAAQILVDRVSLAYGTGESRRIVLQNVDLAVERGAFVSLIGPSGCGKSTLLRLLAGLLEPSEGQVRVAGFPAAQAAGRRLIGLVFQEANLLPWKSALDNAGLLLEVADKSLSKAMVRERARAILELVGLEAAAALRPSQLSGGMRQRVAIARALALDPEILLMDEPFGALDAILREEMSYFLLDLWERTGKTIVFVTHSIDEAVLLSSRVHVMGVGPGRIVDSIDIPLPMPRGPESFQDPRFSATGMRLRGLLQEGHGIPRRKR